MSMGGPIYHVRSPRAADCDPQCDEFDSGYLGTGCEKWANAIQALIPVTRDDVHKARERLDRLRRRADWLRTRIEQRGRTNDVSGHDKAELSALVWIIDLAENVIGQPTKGESHATSKEETGRD